MAKIGHPWTKQSTKARTHGECVRKPGGSWCSNRVAGDKTSVRPSLFIVEAHVCPEPVQIMYRGRATLNIYKKNDTKIKIITINKQIAAVGYAY